MMICHLGTIIGGSRNRDFSKNNVHTFQYIPGTLHIKASHQLLSEDPRDTFYIWESKSQNFLKAYRSPLSLSMVATDSCMFLKSEPPHMSGWYTLLWAQIGVG